MSSALALHESRVASIKLVNGVVAIYFCHAYIHKSKGKQPRDRASGWSQKAKLGMSDNIFMMFSVRTN